MADELQRAGVVHGAEDRRPDQRHLEERPVPRKQLSKRHQPEPRRAGARGADRGNRSWTPALQRERDRVLQHRRAREAVRRSPEPGGSPAGQEPALRRHEDAGGPRHLQPVQLEHAGRVSNELLGAVGDVNVSEPDVDHGGALLQDQRAVRFLIGQVTRLGQVWVDDYDTPRQ